jgi:hypothetical protein
MRKLTGVGIALVIAGAVIACRESSPGTEPPTGAVSEGLTAAAPTASASAGLPAGRSTLITNDGSGTTIAAGPPTQFEGPEALPPKKAPQGAQPVLPAWTETDRVLAKADALPSEAPLRVSILLADVADPDPHHGFASRADRRAALDARKGAIALVEAPVLSWLNSIGATNITALQHLPVVNAVVPAGKVRGILARQDVKSLSRDDDVVVPADSWSGKTVQDALRTWNLHTTGFDAHHGSTLPGNGRIRVAIIEVGGNSNLPYMAHPVWKKSLGGSRIIAVKDCGQAGCPLITPPSTPGGGHATLVGGLLAGSIERGEDPSFPGTDTDDQRKRSGMIREPYLIFYSASIPSQIAAAIDDAVDGGVDVINMSLALEQTQCDASADLAYLNEALHYAVNWGVLPVVSLGNTGNARGNCTLTYPSYRPEAIGAAALRSIDANVSYEDLPIWQDDDNLDFGSARGGMVIGIHNSGTNWASGIALSAPGCVAYGPVAVPLGGGLSVPGYADPTTEHCGTSESAPIIAGLAGGIRDAFAASPLSGGRFTADRDDVGMLMANLLVMGDGWQPSGTHSKVGMDWLSGAGKVRAHWPSNNVPGGDNGPTGMVGPWAWGWRYITLTPQNPVAYWPVGNGGVLPSTVTQWKWAVHWMPLSMTDVPDIDFSVEWTCAPSGVVTLYADNGYDFRTRFRLDQGDLLGRCLRMKAFGYSIPANGLKDPLVCFLQNVRSGFHPRTAGVRAAA